MSNKDFLQSVIDGLPPTFGRGWLCEYSIVHGDVIRDIAGHLHLKSGGDDRHILNKRWFVNSAQESKVLQTAGMTPKQLALLTSLNDEIPNENERREAIRVGLSNLLHHGDFNIEMYMDLIKQFDPVGVRFR